jgi:hypothetical protein
LRGFPRLEAGVVEWDSRLSRLESASKTVASLSKCRFARTGVGESQAASWALSCSILAVAAARS